MNYRIIGAILVILSSGGMGFSLAAAHKKEVNTLKQLLRALDFMACELEYRLPPLDELCYLAGGQVSGAVNRFFSALAIQLRQQVDTDACRCVEIVLKQQTDLSPKTARELHLLGKSLGRFDLAGQISGIRSVKELCERDLQGLQADQATRLRTYRTLGICAGIALVILFI